MKARSQNTISVLTWLSVFWCPSVDFRWQDVEEARPCYHAAKQNQIQFIVKKKLKEKRRMKKVADPKSSKMDPTGWNRKWTFSFEGSIQSMKRWIKTMFVGHNWTGFNYFPIYCSYIMFLKKKLALIWSASASICTPDKTIDTLGKSDKFKVHSRRFVPALFSKDYM